MAWHHRRVGLAARMYRARRELAVAFESDGGVKALLYGALARRREAARAPAGRRSRRTLARRGEEGTVRPADDGGLTRDGVLTCRNTGTRFGYGVG